jgi:hypothetical protein
MHAKDRPRVLKMALSEQGSGKGVAERNDTRYHQGHFTLAEWHGIAYNREEWRAMQARLELHDIQLLLRNPSRWQDMS